MEELALFQHLYQDGHVNEIEIMSDPAGDIWY